jgi:hypothetical protein
MDHSTAFALCLLARIMTGQYGMDDWTMIIAMVVTPKIKNYTVNLYIQRFVVPLSAMAVVRTSYPALYDSLRENNDVYYS